MAAKTYLTTALTISLFLIVLAFSTTAHTKIIYVDDDAAGTNNGSSWFDAFNYLQDALAVAKSGDEIRVAKGVYKPDKGAEITPGDRNATFELRNGVTVKGGYAGFGEPEPDARNVKSFETILSGDLDGNDVDVNDPCDLSIELSRAENSYHVVTASGTDRSAVLDGFTISGGNANGSYLEDENCGAGIYSAGNPTLTSCTIIGNSASSDWPPVWSPGGGMYNEGGSPMLTNCTFIGNSASDGGGMFTQSWSHPVLNKCTFIGNSASKCGGGMYNRHSPNIPTTLTNCVFIGNSAGCEGGGMQNASYSVSTVLTNCVFTGNSATRGGGMSNYFRSTAILTNCTFSGNSAYYGKAVWCEMGAFIDPQHPSEVRLTNCILWDDGNELWNDPKSRIIVSCTNVQGGWPGQNNVNADPLFMDADGPDNLVGTNDDNLRLLKGSPCINAGYNLAVPPSVQTDLDGNPRIMNGTVDMGAYEGPNQGIVLSTKSLTVPEGDTAAFTVTLAMDPLTTMHVTVTVESGDPDITVKSGTTLTFDSSNYSQPQTVILAAAEDIDYFNSTAVIEANATALSTVRVIASEWDNDAPIVLYVDDSATGAERGTSWTDAFTDLQDALGIAAMVPQIEEIHVAQGVYTPTEPSGDRTSTFRLVAGVTMKGGYAGFGASDPNSRDVKEYETILSGDLNGNDIEVSDTRDLYNDPYRGENSYHVITANLAHQTTATLEGFTISGGNANGSYPNYCGGGIRNVSGSPMLFHCSFKDDSAIYGGGMYNSESTSPTLVNCIFSRNSADRTLHGLGGGGGMYNRLSTPIVTNCTFQANSASEGGGISNSTSYPVLTKCTFRDNISGSGGGLHNLFGKPIVTDCIFIGNSAGDGGGMCNRDLFSGVTVTNCIFSGNTAVKGGGLYNYYSIYVATALANCIFAGNYAHDGGGIHSDASIVILTNCTFAENSSTNGNALGCDSYEHRRESNVRMINCILWNGGNEIWNRDGSTITITYSDVQGNWPGEGNIDSDPRFFMPGYWNSKGMWIDGDYHLLPDSPCIDAGTDAKVYIDIEGNIRPFDYPGVDNNGELPEFDMGSYEMLPWIKVPMKLTPKVINCHSRGKWIKAHFVLPEGYTIDDVDTNTPATIEQLSIESEDIDVFVNEAGLVEVVAAYGRAALCSALSDYWSSDIVLTIRGSFTDCRHFCGIDTVKFINKPLECVALLSTHWLRGDCRRADCCEGTDINRDYVVNFKDFAFMTHRCMENNNP